MSNTCTTAASEGLGATQTAVAAHAMRAAAAGGQTHALGVLVRSDRASGTQPARPAAPPEASPAAETPPSLCAAWQPWPAGRALPGN